MLETMPDYLRNELIKFRCVEDICRTLHASFMWFMWIAEFLIKKK